MQSYLLECLPAALGGWPDINIYDTVNQYFPTVSAVVSPAFGTHTKMVAPGSTVHLYTATAHQLNSNTNTSPTALPSAPICAIMERADSGAPDPAPPTPILHNSNTPHRQIESTPKFTHLQSSPPGSSPPGSSPPDSSLQDSPPPDLQTPELQSPPLRQSPPQHQYTATPHTTPPPDTQHENSDSAVAAKGPTEQGGAPQILQPIVQPLLQQSNMMHPLDFKQIIQPIISPPLINRRPIKTSKVISPPDFASSPADSSPVFSPPAVFLSLIFSPPPSRHRRRTPRVRPSSSTCY